MATSWEKFWELMDQPIPPNAIHPAMPDKGIFGDYLTGQYATHRFNQITREAGLTWRAYKTGDVFRLIDLTSHYLVIVELTIEVSGGDHLESRLGCGVGRAIAPFDRNTGAYKTITPQQIDTSEKAAWTDALKNAMSKFGRHLGGELYFDERDAALLGWQIESGKITQHPVEDTAEQASQEDLGQTVLTYGWGKEKKWAGMTLEQIYETDDGRGAMAWCAEDKARQGTWANKMFAKYFEQRQQDDKKPASTTGKPADQISHELAVELNRLISEHIGPDMLFGHANHVKNHLKSHYHCDKVADLTLEKADAFARYVKSDGKDRDPKYYEAEQDKVELFGLDDLGSLMASCADKLPKEWRGNPVGWLNLYNIVPPLNKRQMDGLRVVVGLINSGAFDLSNIGKDKALVKVFEDAMAKVAANGTPTEQDIPF